MKENKIDREFFKTLTLKVLNGDFSIIKSKKFYPDAFANIKASDSYTVIIEHSKLRKKDIIDIEKSFKIIRFDMIIPLNLVGFIAEIANALASEKISILIVSSYSTDHIIVRKKDLARTIKVLHKLGVRI
jgi:hypothetical protein